MRKYFFKSFYLYDRYISNQWNEYSKLIIKSDNYSWVFDNIKKELKNLYKNINVEVVRDSYFYNSKNQCVLFLSKYDVLQHIDNINHKVAFSYFHGNPKISKNNLELFKRFLGKIDLIDKIHVSNSIMENVLLENKVSKDKIYKIPISIDINKFFRLENKNKIKKELNLPINKKIIGSFQKDGIGWGKGLEPKLEKGPDILIKALIEIKKRYSDIHVLLTGPSRGYVIKNLIQNNISYTNAKFVDFKLINKLYNSLDLYLVTSREEGGPRAILESMATGIPIISTKVGQAIDLINHNNNGFLTEINDFSDIGNIAIDIFEGKYDLKKILHNARITSEINSYDGQLNLWKDFLKNYIIN